MDANHLDSAGLVRFQVYACAVLRIREVRMTDSVQGAAQADHVGRSKPVFAISLAQIWTLAGIAVTVLAGAFGFGVFVEKTRSEATVASKDQEIAKLKIEVDGYQRAVDALKRALEDSTGIRQTVDTKAELLNRLVGYLQGRDEVSKTLLVNVVCSMWRESETKRVRLVTEPIRIDERDLVRGLPPDVERFLSTKGISAQMLNDIRSAPTPRDVSQVGPFRIPVPDRVPGPEQAARQSIGDVMKRASQAEVIKIIKFSDGSQYQMPQEIALAVHLKPECAPQR